MSMNAKDISRRFIRGDHTTRVDAIDRFLRPTSSISSPPPGGASLAAIERRLAMSSAARIPPIPKMNQTATETGRGTCAREWRRQSITWGAPGAGNGRDRRHRYSPHDYGRPPSRRLTLLWLALLVAATALGRNCSRPKFASGALIARPRAAREWASVTRCDVRGITHASASATVRRGARVGVLLVWVADARCLRAAINRTRGVPEYECERH